MTFINKKLQKVNNIISKIKVKLQMLKQYKEEPIWKLTFRQILGTKAWIIKGIFKYKLLTFIS